jgi:hypothetical protein
MQIFTDQPNRIVKLFLSQALKIGLMVLLVGLLSSGCAQFVIKEEDQGSVVIGKVLYRTVFAIFTLGYSEVKIHEATEEYEREQKLKAFETRVMEFLDNGQISQAQADEMIRKEKERIWSEEVQDD